MTYVRHRYWYRKDKNSKGLPQYFIFDIMDEDVACPFGLEDKNCFFLIISRVGMKDMKFTYNVGNTIGRYLGE